MPFYNDIKYIYLFLVSIPFIYVIYDIKKFRIEKIYAFLLIPILISFLYSLQYYDLAILRSSISWIILSLYPLYFRKYIRACVIMKIILFTIIFFSLDTLVQIIFGTDIFGRDLSISGRATGPFGWQSPAIGTFVGTFFLYVLNDVKQKYKIPLTLLFIFVILASGTRSAIAQILFVYFILFLNTRNKIIFTFCLFLIVNFVLLDIFSELDIYNNNYLRALSILEIEETFIYESRDSGRLTLWSNYLPFLFKNYLLTGTGLGGLEYILVYDLSSTYIHPHHLYLELLLTFGILLVIPILYFLFTTFYYSTHNNKVLFLSFFGPFNMLHSIFDLYWSFILFLTISLLYIKHD